jgi:DNA-binding NtrC family response regulator
VIEHGVVMSNGDRIGMEHLPEFLRSSRGEETSSHRTDTNETQIALASRGDLNLHVLEQRAIADALARTAGNRTRAAEMLGISRRTLQRKLKETGFDGRL